MKIITSVTVFNDAVGMRMSATYSEVDEAAGRVVSDNKRFDRVVTDEAARTAAQALMAFAGAALEQE